MEYEKEDDEEAENALDMVYDLGSGYLGEQEWRRLRSWEFLSLERLLNIIYFTTGGK